MNSRLFCDNLILFNDNLDFLKILIFYSQIAGRKKRILKTF